MFIIGTGVGGGIIANGQLVRGVHFTAGEYSFVNTNAEAWDAPDQNMACQCSTSNLLKWYRARKALPEDAPLDGRSFFAAANAGEPEALEVLRRFCHAVAVQIYNHWRKHLLGAYWQRLGMTVIPSICWSDESSFAWCFDGEPVGGTVAVSSVGAQKSPAARKLFLCGYREMLRRLKPEKILFFGDVPDGCEGNLEHHPAYYTALAHARKKR